MVENGRDKETDWLDDWFQEWSSLTPERRAFFRRQRQKQRDRALPQIENGPSCGILFNLVEKDSRSKHS